VAGGPAAAGGGAGQAAAGSGDTTKPAGQGIQASDEVFRDDVLRTYELTFTDEDWAELQRTATQEIFVPVMLSVEGKQIGKVGIRYKGAFGTLTGCFEDGKQTCRKLSMKVKFDEYDSSLRFHGLKKLNFHSSLRDGSHLHERLGYKLFREFGVLAPRSAHARIKINGEYKGLYNLTEEVDGRFTDYRFEGQEGQGTVYKEAWPAFSQDAGYYTDAQQTNEGSSTEKIVQFADALAGASSSQLGAVVNAWMDPVATLRYLAVHQAIKHWDGPLTFYCNEFGSCENHNYFFYESATRNQIALIAWDLDNIFYEQPITDQAEVPEWYESIEDCDRRWRADETGDVFLAPSCDRLVQGFVQLGLDKYRTTLDELLQGPLKVAPLQADVDRWAAQIDDSVKTDPAGSGYEDWRGNVDYLKTMIAKRRTAMQVLRDEL
jgi:spore coat protein CotH